MKHRAVVPPLGRRGRDVRHGSRAPTARIRPGGSGTRDRRVRPRHRVQVPPPVPRPHRHQRRDRVSASSRVADRDTDTDGRGLRITRRRETVDRGLDPQERGRASTGSSETRATASNGGTMVLLGRGPYRRPTPSSAPSIWRSTDGRHWERDAPDLDRPSDSMPSQPGGRASSPSAANGHAGGRVDIRTDGATLARQSVDERPRPRVDAVDRRHQERDLVAFGGRVGHRFPCHLDLTRWHRVARRRRMRPASGSRAASRPLRPWTDGHSRSSGPGDYLAGRIEVWATTGRAEWEQVATLPGGDGSRSLRAAGGPLGWVALGTRRIPRRPWRGTPRTGCMGEGRERAPDVSTSILGVDAGFIATGAVGSLADETCGDQRAYHGHTWTSADGRTWQHMAISKDFEWASISALLVVGRNLVGIGGSYPGVRATSRLVRPDAVDSSRSHRPASSPNSSDRPSTPQTCGG